MRGAQEVPTAHLGLHWRTASSLAQLEGSDCDTCGLPGLETIGMQEVELGHGVICVNADVYQHDHCQCFMNRLCSCIATEAQRRRAAIAIKIGLSCHEQFCKTRQTCVCVQVQRMQSGEAIRCWQEPQTEDRARGQRCDRATGS